MKQVCIEYVNTYIRHINFTSVDWDPVQPGKSICLGWLVQCSWHYQFCPAKQDTSVSTLCVRHLAAFIIHSEASRSHLGKREGKHNPYFFLLLNCENIIWNPRNRRRRIQTIFSALNCIFSEVFQIKGLFQSLLEQRAKRHMWHPLKSNWNSTTRLPSLQFTL